MKKKRRYRDQFFRDLHSYLFSIDPVPVGLLLFVKCHIWPKLNIKGYKLAEKQTLVVHMIQNLIVSWPGCVADTADWHQPGAKLRRDLWKAIDEAGFARTALGSEMSGKQTRYRATKKLFDLQETWELNLLLDLYLRRNTEQSKPTFHALVVLHTGRMDESGHLLEEDLQRQPVPFEQYISRHAQPGEDGKPDPRAIENGLNHFRAIEDEIERINRNNSKHAWEAFVSCPLTGREQVRQVNVCLRQFHVGQFFRAVRLYTWGKELSAQNLPKSVRTTMLIDGDPVAELDFSGMFLRMLYHLKGVDPDPEQDLYRPEVVFPRFHSFDKAAADKRDVVRDFVKRATNICVNTSSQSAANSSVGMLLTMNEERDYLKQLIYTMEDTNSANCAAYP